MGVFDRFKAAKARGGSFNWFRDGEFCVALREAKFDNSANPKKRNAEYFATQCTIIEASPLEEGMELDPNMAAGKVVDWTTSEDQNGYDGNVKQFWIALCGVTEQELAAADARKDDKYERVFKAATDERQAATGRLFHVIAKTVKTKAGNDFTAVRWMPVPEEDQKVKFEDMLKAAG